MKTLTLCRKLHHFRFARALGLQNIYVRNKQWRYQFSMSSVFNGIVNNENGKYNKHFNSGIQLKYKTNPCLNTPIYKLYSFGNINNSQFSQAVKCRQDARFYSTAATNLVSFQNLKLRAYIDSLMETYDCVKKLSSESKSQPVDASVYKLGPLVDNYKDYLEKQATTQELESIIKESTDQDMLEMARADLEEVTEQMAQLEQLILDLLQPGEVADESDIILEVTSGVGGQEAMLFTKEVYQMYSRYAAFRGWQFAEISYDETDQGGLRKASGRVSGQGVYQYLKYEGGVHRVQRVPRTERTGRIHTSTMTVAVMPVPTEIDIVLNPKDLKITTSTARGPGGQHVNKTETAVRIVHLPTGIVADCQVDRSQVRNKELALQILRSRLYEKELVDKRKKEVTQRKLQVGSSGRSEKIRTYNYNQDRVTDHRVGVSLHHIQGVLAGGEPLHELMEELQAEGRRESLLECVEQWERGATDIKDRKKK